MSIAVPMQARIASLNFEDGEVVVTSKDRDVFLISAERATEACREAIRQDERVKRFQSELLLPLYRWSMQNEGKVRACYLTVPGRSVQIFVVGILPKFDLDLATSLAALELQLAKKGWRIDVSQLPNADEESLATFFKPAEALEIYAQQGSASSEGSA